MTEEERREAEQLVRRMIELIGDDPDREGLVETPKRVVRSWEELYSGYKEQVDKYIKIFIADYEQVVVMKGIRYYSMCEHHMLPFYGSIDIAYLPGEGQRVIGLSKLARIVNIFTRRLQIQERMTKQIADVIMETVGAKGVAVVVSGVHLCMVARGVEQDGAVAITSAMRGLFRDDIKLRYEIMRLMEKD